MSVREGVVAPPASQLEDALQHAGPGEHFAANGQDAEVSSAQQHVRIFARRDLQGLAAVVFGARVEPASVDPGMDMFEAPIVGRKRVAITKARRSPSLRRASDTASPTVPSGASCNRSRSATAWIAAEGDPAPEREVRACQRVGQGEQARREVDRRSRTCSVDLRHDVDASLLSSAIRSWSCTERAGRS